MKNEKDVIYFITSNNHKFNEIKKLFGNEKIPYQLKQLNLETIEIQTESVRENATFKLNSAKSKVNCSCFVEDAGFFVDDPLNGFPGVYSSYVYKTIGNEGILRLINNFKQSKAHFIAIIALIIIVFVFLFIYIIKTRQRQTYEQTEETILDLRKKIKTMKKAGMNT